MTDEPVTVTGQWQIRDAEDHDRAGPSMDATVYVSEVGELVLRIGAGAEGVLTLSDDAGAFLAGQLAVRHGVVFDAG